MIFSLVIPTYNNLKELETCLGALDLLENRDFEVLVCVDGSTDGTLEFLQEAHFGFALKVLTHPDGLNHGRSAARNLALGRISGKYLLFLDSDMEARPDLLDRHLEVLQNGPTISLGPVEYRNQGQNLWARYLSVRGICKFAHGEAVPHNYFITPNTALPAAWVEDLGGFDEAINRYGGEDMELGVRLHQRFQPRFVFNAQAVVSTVQEKPLSKALAELREYGATGLPYITRKFPELDRIYWVYKCHSPRLKDRFFEWLTRPVWQALARVLLRIPLFALQKQVINYLVVSAVHEGYRKA
ncbi:MAG: glycosyltransferase [Bacteroidia bacterium]|nr:glycosyltransferase [Bacteroidia bacterium]